VDNFDSFGSDLTFSGQYWLDLEELVYFRMNWSTSGQSRLFPDRFG